MLHSGQQINANYFTFPMHTFSLSLFMVSAQYQVQLLCVSVEFHCASMKACWFLQLSGMLLLCSLSLISFDGIASPVRITAGGVNPQSVRLPIVHDYPIIICISWHWCEKNTVSKGVSFKCCLSAFHRNQAKNSRKPVGEEELVARLLVGL